MNSTPTTILITHANTPWRRRMQRALNVNGLTCTVATNHLAWSEVGDDLHLGCLILSLPNAPSEVEALIGSAKQHFPTAVLIVVMENYDHETALRAYHAGAWDCLTRQVTAVKLRECVLQALEVRPDPARILKIATVDREIAEPLQQVRQGAMEKLACDEQVNQSGGCDTVGESLDASSLETDSPVRRPKPDAIRWFERVHQRMQIHHVESIRALIAAVEAKDPYTRTHSVTVADYTEQIGQRMNLTSQQLAAIRSAALLHDIGKIGVPDAILTKPGPLTEDEFNIIKRHPETALDILSHFSFLTEERPIILHHHERFDGTGYPSGLAGQHIPIGSRIVSVADALDTMLSLRSYKKPHTLEEALEELRSKAGTQFDPEVVQAALAWLDEQPEDIQMTQGSATANETTAAPTSTSTSTQPLAFT